MKSILSKPNEIRYNNADHVEYHKMMYPICSKYGTVINVPELLTAYQGKVTQEDTIYKWIRRSEFTEKKAEADSARDHVYTGLISIVRVCQKHFDPTMRDYAHHVYNLLDNYGDLTRVDYDSETAGIDSIVTRLNSSEYIVAVQALGLTPWVIELTEQNAQFKSYVEDAMQEQVDKPDISFRTARRETDGALRRITDRVTALININGPDAYAGFVEEFNVLTNHYNTLVHEHYGRLHARTDITEADIVPIETQPYTGKPVYVIPAVSLRKTAKDGTETVVELVFSQDFTVAYKNNTGPGTATLYIKGIDKYAGELTTTFHIE